MIDVLTRVLELQGAYNSANTDEMEERGILIRTVIPKEIEAANISHGFSVEGRDGTGLKSKVPWVRIYDLEASPSATLGWYVVFLFHELGDFVSLSLNQGTTEFIEGEFRPRPNDVLRNRVQWANEQIEEKTRGKSRLQSRIDLGTSRLARSYSAGHVTGFSYEKSNLEEAVLVDDILYLLDLLEEIYERESVMGIPEEASPEVRSLQILIEAAAGKKIVVGAPRRRNPDERKAIELHAMNMVEKHFRSIGWKLRDTSKNKPYDFIAQQGDTTLYIEVKGTTTSGQEVILTANEVGHHLANHPNTCLAIVRNIILLRDAEEPSCTGGELKVFLDWKPELQDLKPLAYSYSVKWE